MIDRPGLVAGSVLHFALLGVGAMNSPRYRPAGVLLTWQNYRVMLDGGGAADPNCSVDAWLVSDDRCELMTKIRRRAAELGVAAGVARYQAGEVRLRPMDVRHTSHASFGYLIEAVRERHGLLSSGNFWTGRPGWISCSPTRQAGSDRSDLRVASVVTHVCAISPLPLARAWSGVWCLLTSVDPALGRSTVNSPRSVSGVEKAHSFGFTKPLVSLVLPA